MAFLPDNYKIPTQSRYMRFEQGANKFRVLDSAITGWEWWTDGADGRKPHRSPSFQQAVKQGTEPIKHFWAFPVWNYSEGQVQILEVTQKTIMNGITSLVQNEDWGDPKEYDITVSRSGEGFDTEYTVTPSPAKPMPAEAKQQYEDLKMDLTALYRGEDPFASESELVADDIASALA